MACTSASEKSELLDSIILTVFEKSDVSTHSLEDIVSSTNRCHTLEEKVEKKQELLVARTNRRDILRKIKMERESELAGARERVQARDADIKSLDNQKRKLEEELSGIVTDLKKQTKVVAEVRQEAIIKIPKDKFLSGLLKNITNIEWDVKTCQDASSVRGAIVAKSGIKTFHFDTANQSDRDIQESLWAMMKEGDNFKTALEQQP